MTIGEMSFQASLVIGMILVLRALFLYRFSAKFFISLWTIAGARLLLPFRLPSFFSFDTLSEKMGMHDHSNSGIPILHEMGERIRLAGDYPIGAGMGVNSLMLPLGQESGGWNYWRLLWLIGAIGLGLFFGYRYWRSCQKFGRSLPIEDSWIENWQSRHSLLRRFYIRQSDEIASPLTYGIFRPIILLPKWICGMDKERLNYILTHEWIHIRHWDILRKLVMLVILCIHWFNPLVWAMYFLLNRDIELSCDESVICRFGREKRLSYAHTLLDMEEYKNCRTYFCVNFNKDATEERLVRMMKMKKTTALGMMLSLVMVISMTSILAASRPEDKNTTTITGSAAESLEKEGKTAKEEKRGQKKAIAIDYIVTMSRTVDGADGKEEYSDDNGKTWITKEEWLTRNPEQPEPEWWTYESYKAWMDKERDSLRGLIGTDEKYYDSESESWKTWTERDVERIIKRYEQTLEDIRQGKVKHSIPMTREIDESTVYEEGVSITMSVDDAVGIERVTDASFR